MERGDDILSLLCEPSFDQVLQREIGAEQLKKYYGATTTNDILLTFSTEHSGHGIYNPADRGVKGEALTAMSFIDRLSAQLMGDLSRIITARVHEGQIPTAGTFLYFTNRLKYAFLFKYFFHSQFGTPTIECVDKIDEPRGLLEIESIANLSSQTSRNFAKSFLTGGHKLILQHGVMTHVDRRIDRNVFGPTIDTLLLTDILFRDNHVNPVERFVEIGCGNGHITTTLAARKLTTKECVAIDANPQAVSCTARNLDANLRLYGRQDFKKFIIYGFFSGSLFNYSADLIVANPPYVALPPFQMDLRQDLYAEAIAGTKLIPDIINAAPRGLRKGGRLLLMVSSTSLDSIERHLPGSHEATNALPNGGLDVPFDVESVLDEPRWLEWLQSKNAIKEVDGSWYHTLKPLWIKEK